MHLCFPQSLFVSIQIIQLNFFKIQPDPAWNKDTDTLKSPWLFFLCLQLRSLIIQRQNRMCGFLSAKSGCCMLAPLPHTKVKVCLPPLPTQRHLHLSSLQLLSLLSCTLSRNCGVSTHYASLAGLPQESILCCCHSLCNWEAWENTVTLCSPPCILQSEWSVSLVQWDGVLLSSRPAQTVLAWDSTTTLPTPCCVPTLLPIDYGYSLSMAGCSTLALN